MSRDVSKDTPGRVRPQLFKQDIVFTCFCILEKSYNQVEVNIIEVEFRIPSAVRPSLPGVAPREKKVLNFLPRPSADQQERERRSYVMRIQRKEKRGTA